MNFQLQLGSANNVKNFTPPIQTNSLEFLSNLQQSVCLAGMSASRVNTFSNDNILVPNTQSQSESTPAQHLVANQSIHPVPWSSNQPTYQVTCNIPIDTTGNANRTKFNQSPHSSTYTKKQKSSGDLPRSQLEQEQAQIILCLKEELERMAENTVSKTEYQKLEAKHARALGFNNLTFLGNATLINTRSQLQKQLQMSSENHKIESAILMEEVNKWKVKFENESSRCETMIGEQNELKKEVELNKSEISHLNLKAKTEEKTNKELSSAVHVLRNKQAKLEQLLKDDKKAHEQELQKLNQGFADKLTEYDTQIDKLRMYNSSLETQLYTMWKQNEAQLRQGCIRQKEISHQLQQLRRVKQEKNALKCQLRRSKAELKAAQTKNKRLQERLEKQTIDNRHDMDIQSGNVKVAAMSRLSKQRSLLLKLQSHLQTMIKKDEENRLKLENKFKLFEARVVTSQNHQTKTTNESMGNVCAHSKLDE